MIPSTVYAPCYVDRGSGSTQRRAPWKWEIGAVTAEGSERATLFVVVLPRRDNKSGVAQKVHFMRLMEV